MPNTDVDHSPSCLGKSCASGRGALRSSWAARYPFFVCLPHLKHLSISFACYELEPVIGGTCRRLTSPGSALMAPAASRVKCSRLVDCRLLHVREVIHVVNALASNSCGYSTAPFAVLPLVYVLAVLLMHYLQLISKCAAEEQPPGHSCAGRRG